MSDSLPIALPEPSRRRHADKLLLVLILLYAGSVRAYLADAPFGRNSEGIGSFYGLLARNYFRHPFSQTFGNPVLSQGTLPNVPPVFYANHPPLIPLLIAGSYAAFGHPYDRSWFSPDWQTRLPTILCTLACIVTIFLLLRRYSTTRLAAIAAFLFASLPMTILYGGHPDVINPQLVLFALLTIAAYLPFHANPSPRGLLILCLAFLPTGYTDWPAYYLVVVLVGHFALTKPLKQWRWMVPFAVVAGAIFFGAYAQIVLVKQDWRWIAEQFRRRSVNSVSDAKHSFTLGQWARDALVGFNLKRHTLPIMALAVAWLLGEGVWLRRGNAVTTLTRLLFAWAALHILVGRQGTYVHDWWWWPLTPALALASAVVLDRAAGMLPARIGVPAIVALLMLFSAWTTRTTLRTFFASENGGISNYSIKELGETIRAAALPNQAVVLTESDTTLTLWYYADRPLKEQVWEPKMLAWRMRDGLADLPFNLQEPFADAPVAVVVPKAYITNAVVRDFCSDLAAHSAIIEHVPKFQVYQLAQKESPAN